MHVVNSRTLISCVIKYLFSSYSFVINYLEVFGGVKGRYNTIPFPTRQPPPPECYTRVYPLRMTSLRVVQYVDLCYSDQENRSHAHLCNRPYIAQL